MSTYRQQAIEDVAKVLDEGGFEFLIKYAEAQRERVLSLEAALEEAENKLRTHDGLVALKNGIPETTGDQVFDEVLRLYPVPAMLQRGWLGSATGFDDLPFLKKSLLRFFEAAELSDLLDDGFWKKSMGIAARAKEGQ